MTKELWLNLPVKDVNKSKEFFTNIGFSINTQHGNTPVSACVIVGTKKIAVMLFAEHVLKTFTGVDVNDTKMSAEIMISFDAESKEEVDELAKKVEAAGGNVYQKPSEMQGWMYGCSFADLDGHRWNALFMDMGKMPK